MKTKFISLLLTLIFLYSCQGAKDALQGKKRSDTNDEFLVEKKNPLTMPPDFNELPVPLDEDQISSETQEENEIKKILEVDNNVKSDNQTESSDNSSLKKSILKKINE